MELIDGQDCDGGHAWDTFLQSCPGASYWQLQGWLSSYLPMGLRCDLLVERSAGRIVAGAAFLSVTLPLGMGRVFILPHGPVCADPSAARLSVILDELNNHFRAQQALYVQTWPHAERHDRDVLAAYAQAGYSCPRLFGAHEFSSTLLAVNLEGRSEEQLLMDARRNTRYYCRAARTTGLELRLGCSQEALTACYRVWSENGEYHGFAPRPLSSYRIVMERLVLRDKGVLLQAWFGDELAGAIMVLFVGQAAVYAAGAIRRTHASLHPAEFLHLSAMQIARERGLRLYDFNNWGSPGTAQFKRGFRPVEHKWAEPRTLIVHPMKARLIRFAESYARPLLRGIARRRAGRTQ